MTLSLRWSRNKRREKVLGAQAVGVEVVDDAPAPDRTILSEPIEEYLGKVKDAKAKKTLLACTLALNLFAGAVKRESLEEIDRKDVLAFIRAMREEKLSPRTIAERILRFSQ